MGNVLVCFVLLYRTPEAENLIMNQNLLAMGPKTGKVVIW